MLIVFVLSISITFIMWKWKFKQPQLVERPPRMQQLVAAETPDVVHEPLRAPIVAAPVTSESTTTAVATTTAAITTTKIELNVTDVENSTADICIATPEKDQKKYREIRCRDKSVYISSIDVIYDSTNVDPCKDVMHLVENDNLITIVIFNTKYIYENMFVNINDTLDKITHIYKRNFILVINEYFDIVDMIGAHEFVNDKCIIIDWSDKRGHVRFPQPENASAPPFCPESLHIITDTKMFGFRDDDANVLFLHNQTSDKFLTWKKIKSIFYTG